MKDRKTLEGILVPKGLIFVNYDAYRLFGVNLGLFGARFCFFFFCSSKFAVDVTWIGPENIAGKAVFLLKVLDPNKFYHAATTLEEDFTCQFSSRYHVVLFANNFQKNTCFGPFFGAHFNFQIF